MSPAAAASTSACCCSGLLYDDVTLAGKSIPSLAAALTALFHAFLVDSRTQIQNHTNTKHIRLQDFPDGKILKINRRNNSLHYRVYQKDQRVRF